ncbi:MAG: AIDA repeat-containing protein, partial [Elusimicrobiales bacterium]|nr:AIDA repeat-containing protein [Elusimicrobiales bacterium]
SHGQTSTVSAGETWISTYISGYPSYSILNVYGTTSRTYISFYGTEKIFSGGIANSATVNSVGGQIVASGGIADGTIVNSGGRLHVESGGSAINIKQNVGGRVYAIVYGDSATYVIGTNENGSFRLENGVADNFVINSDAYQYVLNGGIANSTLVNSRGSQEVRTGGTVNDTIINENGSQMISSGGIANDTVVNGLYGTQYISSGGIANRTTLSDMGYQYLYSGGTANNTVLNSGGQQRIYGTANNTVVSNYGYQHIYSGGSVNNTVINSNGSQMISSGGLSISTTINSGGKQFVQSAGVASATDIKAGGWQIISAGGSAIDYSVEEGGSQVIMAGGFAANAAIFSGGSQIISSGGNIINMTLSSGGTQDILPGGAASGTVISRGGIMNLSFGGIASDLTVNNGGTAVIYGNNILSGDNVLSSGGEIRLSRPDISTPVVLTVETLSANGGTVAMNMNFAQPGESDKIVISGTHTGNAIISIKTVKGGEPVKDDSLKVVEYSGGAAADGTFSLKGGKWDTGWYEYTLDRGDSDGNGNDYYLRSTGEMTPIAKTTMAAPEMANAAVNVALNSLQKRLGDLRNMGDGNAQHGTWARGYYQSLTLKDKVETEMKVSGMEAGYDFRLSGAGSSNGEGTYLGIMAGKTSVSGINGKSKAGNQESKGEGTGILGGAYLTYIGEAGFFADLTARAGTNKLDLSAYSASEGDWLKFSPKRTFVAASMEAGMSFGNGGLKIEPKAEMQYMNISGKDVEIDGLDDKIKFGGTSYITAIGTLNAAYSWKRSNGLITQPYAEISYSQGLSGEEEITYAENKDKASMKGGFIEGRIGLNMQLTENLYWHAAASIESGKKQESFGADAGMRYMFGQTEKSNQKPKYEIVKEKAAAEFAALDYSADSISKTPYTKPAKAKESFAEEVVQAELENVRIPMAQRKNHNAIAVIIGARNYDSGINPVAYAHNDALLVRDFVIKTFGYDKENIIYVEDPTKANLEQIFGSKDDYKAQLNNWIKPGKSDVFIYYAGHGAPDQDTRTAYFVPKDANPDYIKIGGYAMETLYANLAKLPARSITVVTDVCFSGQDGSGKMIIKSASPLAVSAKIPVAGTGANSKITVFNASKGSEMASWYDAKQHGLFTYYFLLGISGEADKDKNKTITAGEMDAYLQEQVPYRARRLYNREQHPMFIGNPTAPIAEYK